MTALFTSALRAEEDVVLARQRARQASAALGFDEFDQLRIATAVTEIARNAVTHAGGGQLELSVEWSPQARVLSIEIGDAGPGMPAGEPAPDGLRERTGGIVTARKLMDAFEIEPAADGGVRVRMQKRLLGSGELAPEEQALLTGLLAAAVPRATAREDERALSRALERLAEMQRELELLNRELDETNRGVMVLYNELEEKAEALRRSQAAKNQFFSEMNHEVRTPINSILNLAELLLNGSLIAPLPEQATALGYIRKAAQHLSELVDDLLELSRSEAGKLVVRPSRFTVESLFGGLRGMFRPLHTREDVRLIFSDGGGLPELYTDEGKVAQILRNFISNALKFTERGSVVVTAELAGEEMVFSVRDTGIGIDPSQHATLFTPFSQIENPHQKRVKGTGLGLSLTRALSELLGGRVEVASELGVGSTFKAIIPRLVPRAGAALPAHSQRDAILIIDDDEIARYLLRGAIGPGNYAYIEASSGSEGLQLAHDHRPRLIFLDLRMPKMDGYEVLDALKADPVTRNIPVVIHTSQRLQPWERERLEQVSVGIVLKEQLHQAPGRAGVQEILAHAGMSPAP